MRVIRVLVADDHTIVREGIVAFLERSGEVQVVAQASDGMDAVEQALRLEPDVVIVDLSMPSLSGIEVVRRLARELPECRTLVLTMHAEEEYVVHSVRGGAAGFLLKDSPSTEVLSAVRALASGRGYFGEHASRVLAQQMQHPSVALDDPYRDLTRREREVFHLVIEGLTTKEIAKRLDTSVKTAENHRVRVLDKLGARNTAELIRYAVRHKLFQ
jgi:two-component system response regulator NreC